MSWAIADTTNPDRPVHIAIQPNYPLALRFRGVCDGTDAVDDPADEPEVSEAVFLLASDGHPDGLVYLPSSLWDRDFRV